MLDAVLTVLTYIVWFLATFFLFFFLLVLTNGRDSLNEQRPIPKGWRPRVSVIAPAFNEEGKIHKTIASLKRIKYPNVEFIIVNDGSRDGTAREVRESIRGDSRFIFIDRKENKGKPASLNEGIARARGEIVATMDADSMVEHRVFEKTLGYFAEKDVAAVTISVCVDKPKTFLHRIIDIEYIIGLSLFLKVFSRFNCVFVTPGPFSLYRRQVVLDIGGFDENNITEDLEIAYRIHKAGYRIENSREAVVRTIVPPTFRAVYVQRRRWYSGAVQTLIQHRGMLFKNRYGAFGLFMPFQFALTILGLTLFILATYLSVSQTATWLYSFRYTGFNLFERLFEFHFDALRIRSVEILGYLAFTVSIVIMFVGLRISGARMRDKVLGMVGYPLLFFLYQIFWIGALIAVVRGRKVAWR